MYYVTVTGNISASHHLRGYQGKCENIHGHNYKVEVTIRATGLDDTGLALDFGILKAFVREVMERFDHKDLNSCEEFSQVNPSSENLARTIFSLIQEKISARLQTADISLDKVKVWETEGNFVTYRLDPEQN